MKKGIIVITTFVLLFGYIGFVSFGRYKLVGIKFLNSQFDKTPDYFNTTNIGEYEDVYFQLYHQNSSSCCITEKSCWY